MLMYKEKTQKQIEDRFSTKGIWKLIKDSIDPTHTILSSMENLIKDYLLQEKYYKSKQIRVNTIKHSPKDIAVIVCAAVLRAQGISPIQAVVTIIGQHLKYIQILDGIKTGAELLALCEPAGLYTLVRASDPNNIHETLEVHPNFVLSKEIQEKIDLTKYLPPMICRPKSWTNNKGGGYLTNEYGSLILRSINNHNHQQNLAAINELQNIAWTINPVFDYEEQTNKELDTTKKQKQFQSMVQESKQVCDDLIKQGNEFYFVWKYDSRGRAYSQGYHCHLQGAQYKKAILSFANKEYITK